MAYVGSERNSGLLGDSVQHVRVPPQRLKEHFQSFLFNAARSLKEPGRVGTPHTFRHAFHLLLQILA